MVVVADTGGQPRAVMVKPIAAGIAEFAVLRAVWDHYLCVCVWGGGGGGGGGGKERGIKEHIIHYYYSLLLFMGG